MAKLPQSQTPPCVLRPELSCPPAAHPCWMSRSHESFASAEQPPDGTWETLHPQDCTES